MARGSLYETLHWLSRAYKRKLITAKQTEDLRLLVAELSPTLNAYLRSVSRSAATATASIKDQRPKT
jgi:four helix bundle protein